MANYRPNSIKLTAVHSGAVNADLSTEYWGLTFLRGVATNPDGSTPLVSGAVAIWEGTNLTTAAADHVTFTNTLGSFGVTVKANTNLVVKVFGK